MRPDGHLRRALRNAEFTRLLAVRFACQFGDGVFQASLAGAVLFDPEHQAKAADVAAGFTVLLLPYSLVGPFAGVLLDRWWRQRVLVGANVVRALAVLLVAALIAFGIDGLPFYVAALVVLSISRFILSAISAGQPHLVEDAELVTANAFAVTAGALFTAAGGGVAVGFRGLMGSSDGDYAEIAAAALLPYLLAAAIATGFELSRLGPSDAERATRETPREVLRGLMGGLRKVRAIPEVASGLLAIGAHRLCYGIWAVCTVLLYRNYFHDDAGVVRTGLSGLAQVVAAIACGGALAAFVTPSAFRRLGAVRWPAVMLAGSAVVVLSFGLPFRLPLMLLTALLLGFASQSFKISVDTLIQHHVSDDFRGRVFTVYDTLFNLALVVAAVLTAVALPEDGHSRGAAIGISAGWLVIAGAYLSSARRTTPSVR